MARIEGGLERPPFFVPALGDRGVRGFIGTAVHGACGDLLRKYPPIRVVGVFFGEMRPAGAKRGAGSKSMKTAPGP